ncbi:MAG: hypothetical protein EA398_00050 [Deltaproteobacteria bacterium]|nr:MAG: hypothetical protein EA398_00050 [Deltaproteobacteria bacterium]
MPLTCDRILDPVCGCDGETWENACVAHQNRVNVRHAGACEDDEVRRCTSDAACDGDDYCFFDPQTNPCGERTEFGVCRARNDCQPQLIVVCGCDGNEYGTPCGAAEAGVNVRSMGPCPDPEPRCTTTEDCPDRTYCVYPDGDACGEESGEGVCELRPVACLPISEPVCGCDGRTWQSACAAAMQGVDVKQEGTCTDDPVPTRCDGNRDCELLTEFCLFPEETECGRGGPGTCTLRPDFCIPMGELSCGCDDRTWTSECAAHQAGVSIRHPGRCPGIDPPFPPIE